MKRRFLVLALVVVFALANVAVAAAADYSIDTVKSSVVRIAVSYYVDPAYNDMVPEELRNAELLTTGSGFAVGEYGSKSVQYFVTAAHVTMHNNPNNPNETTKYLPLVDGSYGYVPVIINYTRILIKDSSSYVNAMFMGRSDRADVALLTIADPIYERTPAVLINTEEFPANAVVTAMGFPAASDDNFTLDVSNQLISTTSSVSTNTASVSRVVPHATTSAGNQIQTNASMSGGISGGPLVDENGYVVGVCTSGSVNDNNTNYAVATSEIIRLLNSQTGVKYTMGPLKNDNLLLYVIIGAGAVIILLVVLIIVSANGKNSKRVLTFGGVLSGRNVPLKKGTPVLIGRDPSKCTVIYPKDTAGVSGIHCTITFDGKNVIVADNGSSYGTFVGGSRVEPGRPVEVHRGQEITFGSGSQSAVLH
ncbi:MAG: trypsin-like peptidase domain-containing protein [Aristaeellaceae bacterium]